MSIFYQREKAVAYAHQWAYGRNPAYINFNGIGGDCTNFVSQCLKAGGAPQNFTPHTGWYYRSAHDRAAAWTGVEFLYQFLTAPHATGPKAKIVDLEKIEPGDIIQLSFLPHIYSHSLFVVSKKSSKENEILVASHSIDSDNRPLSTYSFRAYRCLHIYL